MDVLLLLLANLAPLAPMVLLAGGMAYWLRRSSGIWIATGLIALCVPGIILTWFLRDVGFNASGGICASGKAHEFMETMQWVFLAQAIAGIAGSAMLGGLAIRRSFALGVLLAVTLGAISIVTGLGINVAAGMTAVDGYRCGS